MISTSATLLERLRHPTDQASWNRFVELYTPLLFHFARRLGLQEQDAADLVQEVMILLIRKLPEFCYKPSSSFRGWLRTVTLNKWRECQRRAPLLGCQAGNVLEKLADPGKAPEFEEEEYRRYLIGRALQLVQHEFPALTWKAFWEYFVAEREPAAVAAELKLTVGSVYAAKSRVLGRLRQQVDGLLE